MSLEAPGSSASKPAQLPEVLSALDHAVSRVNRWVMLPCMLALLAAAAILTYSVAARYFFKIPTEWQDETAVFLLIGATFVSGAFVQSKQGHVGVEAIADLLPDWANRLRHGITETLSLMFCSFFSWKSWTLFREALHEGFTSNSTWGPPLWIPYLLMACGMTLLALQLLLDVARRISVKNAGR